MVKKPRPRPRPRAVRERRRRSHDRGLQLLAGRSLRDGGADDHVTNIGEKSHTFTTDDEALDETIGAGETLEIPLTGVSSGGFHCRFHTQMTGTLTVG